MQGLWLELNRLVTFNNFNSLYTLYKYSGLQINHKSMLAEALFGLFSL